MRPDLAPVIRLADYRPPDYLVDRVELEVSLHPGHARVRSRLTMRRNAGVPASTPVRLDGEDLALLDLRLDGAPLPSSRYDLDAHGLTLRDAPERFTLAVETRVEPEANTKLEGLYRSNGVWCTQCEAQGFRRITFYPDRPDVMAPFRVRLEADRTEAPLLLSNGNPAEAGDAGGGRHYAVWDDPHLKPSYLFALVAGRLDTVADRFITRSGRDVRVAVHVEPGKADRAGYALDALKRSMRWDEERFGLEYDLDEFNIVAVADFNMGAMENKGLNIFNDRYVLASPETATDADYEAIEAIVAHEYFHNWTGNRITCRDWFQLTLKEGLTVFRDQEFTADTRSRAVKRIGDVRALRAAQFAEDAGPLAHPCRPKTYREINNFYTATVYEKGAEVIRALRTLIGSEAFARGLELYFERHDGRAATLEDFIAGFAEASGRDLSDFFAWWEQAGTPKLVARAVHDAAAATLTLDLAQSTAPTPGEDAKRPLVLPVAFGLVGADGPPARVEAQGLVVREDGVIELSGERGRAVFGGVRAAPGRRIAPSLLRGFSAPVSLEFDLDEDDLSALLAGDDDPFNRWQAAQSLALRALVPAARAGGDVEALDAAAARLGASLEAALAGVDDPAFAALLLTLPSELDVAREVASEVDPDRVRLVRRRLVAALGRALRARVDAALDAGPDAAPYSPDGEGVGRRRLRQAALLLRCEAEPARGAATAAALFRSARTMTDTQGALAALCAVGGDDREAALGAFEARWRHDPLVLDKWFALQATIPEPATVERVRGLMTHPGFAAGNPNRVRALVGSFANANPSAFHRPDGAGHRLVAEVASSVDGANPQMAARLLTAFRSWRSLEPRRRASARAALEGVLAAETLSPDLSDIASRSLA